MMHEPSISIEAVSPFIIDNAYLLKYLETLNFNQALDPDILKESMYKSYWLKNPYVPDHVFKNRWEHFLEKKKDQKSDDWLIFSLCLLANHYLENVNFKIHPKMEHYSDWQNLLSKISSIPIRAAFFLENQSDNAYCQFQLEQNSYHLTNIIHPYDPVVDEYILSEGLNETHLHLNGTTFAEICWLRALNTPKAEIKDFCKSYQLNPLIKEMCHSIDSQLNPERLSDLLNLANRIRTMLIKFVLDSQDKWLAPIRKFDKSKPTLETVNSIAQLKLFEHAEFNLPFKINSLSEEFNWMVYLLKRMKSQPNVKMSRLFHIYILIQNQYLHLLVQKEDMYGFDQFQKYTLTELREPAEKEYYERFKCLHGGLNQSTSRINWLEGRFAPKDDFNKMVDIILAILKGYLEYLYDCLGIQKDSIKYLNLNQILKETKGCVQKLSIHNPRSYLKLALVVHFIKRKWEPKKESFRFQALHDDLRERTLVLSLVLQSYPELYQWIRGIDAAANELHTPPEVFAPYFRYCQKIGILHQTYHAGEDFIHILGGIRQIIDVVNLLDFKLGNRIGHATALGIDVNLWLRTMPTYLMIKKSDWLIDLLMTWKYLQNSSEHLHVSSIIYKDFMKIAYEIFGESISCEVLYDAMCLRGLEPKFILQCINNNNQDWWKFASLNDYWRDEAKLVQNAYSKKTKSIKLFEPTRVFRRQFILSHATLADSSNWR